MSSFLRDSCLILLCALGSAYEVHPEFSPMVFDEERAPPGWVYDAPWFNKQLALNVERSPDHEGCCPAAVTLYTPRYETIGLRCCSNRLAGGQILPLRPDSDSSGVSLLWQKIKSTHVLFAGDSFAEQHFLAFLCHAWSTKGLTIRNLHIKRHNSTWVQLAFI
jgi:hypothetical protein